MSEAQPGEGGGKPRREDKALQTHLEEGNDGGGCSSDRTGDCNYPLRGFFPPFRYNTEVSSM